MDNQTHWKKNLDTRYISGEDLKHSLNGLAPEMVVLIEKFENVETFDQNQQKKSIKTGLFLTKTNGEKLYKPVILNKTNATFLKNEFKSPFLENWIKKPVVLYACKDIRHGYVVRFKKYSQTNVNNGDDAIAILNSSKNLEELKENWLKISEEEKKIQRVIKVKEELKIKLS